MRALAKVDGNGEQRARVSNELRQLKQMSKGLRSKATRALLERHATPRLAAKSTVLPQKPRTAAAA